MIKCVGNANIAFNRRFGPPWYGLVRNYLAL
jgi:hypothetical protein